MMYYIYLLFIALIFRCFSLNLFREIDRWKQRHEISVYNGAQIIFYEKNLSLFGDIWFLNVQ